MATGVILAVFLLGSFSALAQDTRSRRAGSVLREYVDKGYCTYTYVVPPGYRAEGCPLPGQTGTSTETLERQLAETKEETDNLKNQVDRLSSMVDTLQAQQSAILLRMDGLSGQLSEETAKTTELKGKLDKCECGKSASNHSFSTPISTPSTELMSPAAGTHHEETVRPNNPVATATTRPRAEIRVRLADGRAPLAGRVEVQHGDGQWGSICDDHWDLQDAHVVCRQLGLGSAAEAKVGGHFGEGSGNIWLDEVACQGNETNLGDCPANSWGRSDCSHKEDAGVICGGTFFRLAGSQSPWEGRVEMRPSESAEWGAVCNTSWSEASAGVVCRQLGYTGGVTAAGHGTFGEGTGRNWLGDVDCTGDESHILDCDFTWEPSNCDRGQAVQVICSGVVHVRLRGGGSLLEGRVEVRAGNGEWGTICDDNWDDMDAHVVCRQLGHYTGVARVGGHFGGGDGHIWLEGLNCTGNETTIADCQSSGWGEHDCTNKEDAGVVCSNVRLVAIGESSTNEGRVEIYHDGEWGTVCHSGWDLNDARVVCRELGYPVEVPEAIGKRTYSSRTYGPVTGPMWLTQVECTGSEAHLSDCPKVGWGIHRCHEWGGRMDSGVICPTSVTAP